MRAWITIAILLGLINIAILYLMAREKQYQTELQLGWAIKEIAETKANYFGCIDECKSLKDSLRNAR
jgi:hypothetical protein